MNKCLKYFVGIIAFIFFFMWIDGSGVGVKQKFVKIKEWANR